VIPIVNQAAHDRSAVRALFPLVVAGRANRKRDDTANPTT
jgi:hypothetical protein